MLGVSSGRDDFSTIDKVEDRFRLFAISSDEEEAKGDDKEKEDEEVNEDENELTIDLWLMHRPWPRRLPDRFPGFRRRLATTQSQRSYSPLPVGVTWTPTFVTIPKEERRVSNGQRSQPINIPVPVEKPGPTFDLVTKTSSPTETLDDLPRFRRIHMQLSTKITMCHVDDNYYRIFHPCERKSPPKSKGAMGSLCVKAALGDSWPYF